MEFIFIIVISFLISFTWVYYFKLIDLFEQEKNLHIIITFILGILTPFLIFPVDDYILKPLGVTDSDNPTFSLLYYVFGVGLIEETIKCLPVIVVLSLFKKAINEPMDYVKYICISALGFAFGENILYALSYGEYVLLGRSILTVPAHMFFSTLFIYGLVKYKYDGSPLRSVFKYVLIGSAAHGIYDFLLDFEIVVIGVVLNILFFFLIISAFITILNNNINCSPFYTPKKVIDQEKVRKFLMAFYIPIIILILGFTSLYKNIDTILSVYLPLMLWKSSILYVLIVRVSRFSIVPKLRKKIRLEFPFYYKSTPDRNDFHLFFGLLTVRGESYNEAAIAVLYEEEIRVIPISYTKIHLDSAHDGIIESKISAKETSIYVLKLYLNQSKTNFKHYLLKSKKSGISHTEENDPIVSLNSEDPKNKNKLIFREWVVLKRKK
ncbi:MAG: putative rane protein [Bacteroidetes bacterium]|nr:putative rane protein [Bacteroidota bacterium]